MAEFDKSNHFCEHMNKLSKFWFGPGHGKKAWTEPFSVLDIPNYFKLNPARNDRTGSNRNYSASLNNFLKKRAAVLFLFLQFI